MSESETRERARDFLEISQEGRYCVSETKGTSIELT
jgi:hypothetical protein